MKLLPLLLPLLLSALDAADGYAVYQKSCAACHIENISKAETLKRFNTLKAPPMPEVSSQLKHTVIIADDDEDVHREVVIAFIKHYIENPDIQYSMCNPMALERFGQMPSLKGKLNADEKQAVAEWIYDNYEGGTFE